VPVFVCVELDVGPLDGVDVIVLDAVDDELNVGVIVRVPVELRVCVDDCVDVCVDNGVDVKVLVPVPVRDGRFGIYVQ
jgi:hypothetical protein